MISSFINLMTNWYTLLPREKFEYYRYMQLSRTTFILVRYTQHFIGGNVKL